VDGFCALFLSARRLVCSGGCHWTPGRAQGACHQAVDGPSDGRWAEWRRDDALRSKGFHVAARAAPATASLLLELAVPLDNCHLEPLAPI